MILAVVGALLLIGNITSVGRSIKIPEEAWLSADLSEGVADIGAQSPWRAYFQGGPVMEDFLFGLREAAQDHRIKALLIRLGSANLGMAQAQEIAEAVQEFRRSGKPAFAYADSFDATNSGMTNYYLATAFDKIYLQPSGDLGLVGFGIEQPFLQGGLDALGILPQMDGRKEYKGALFSLTKTEMPQAVRTNLQQLTDDWFNQSLEGITASRKITLSDLKNVLGKAPFSAEQAKDLKLIDDTLYKGQAKDLLLRSVGLSENEEIDLSDYWSSLRGKGEGKTKIALIPVTGEIVSGRGDLDNGRVGSDTIAEALQDAVADKVSAIILRIDSPGGSYLAADAMWYEVASARAQGIPVIVSMGNVAASGGYFLALPADELVADAASLVGSIGVFGGKIVLKGLWDKLHIAIEGVSSGEHALMESPHRPYSPEEWQKLEQNLDRIYADFTRKVAEGRKLPLERMDQVAGGQIFSGARAKELGLIDEVGGLDKAIQIAKEAAHLSNEERISLLYFPDPERRAELLIGEIFRRLQTRASLIDILQEEVKGIEQNLRLPYLFTLP